MPTPFTAATTVYISGSTQSFFHGDTRCREGWINSIKESRGYWWTLPLPAGTRTEVELNIESRLIEDIRKACEELQSLWFPEVSFTFTSKFRKDWASTHTQSICAVSSPGLLAISFVWWLALIYRFLLNNGNKYENLELLLKDSPSECHGLYWYSYLDKEEHIDLIAVFNEVRYPEMWFQEDGVYGPIGYNRLRKK